MEKEERMKKIKGTVSHHESSKPELRADRNSQSNTSKPRWNNWTTPKIAPPDCWRCAMWPKPTVAWGGRHTGRHQSRSLVSFPFPKGNPTLKTLLAVLKSVGMRLSVEPRSTPMRDCRALA